MQNQLSMINGYQVITDMNMTTTKLCLKSRLSKVRVFKKKTKLRVTSYKKCPSTEIIISENKLIMHPATFRKLQKVTA